mgnify:CR=1 FL=1
MIFLQSGHTFARGIAYSIAKKRAVEEGRCSMGKGGKCETHFRVALQAVREDVRGNLRRAAKGVACVEIGEQYGEVLLSVENLRYLGTAPNGWPYFYEGWMILDTGCKIDMGPISTDCKGNGKGYWRFAAAGPGNGGIAAGDVAGFMVTVAARECRLYPAELVVLAGMLPKTVPAPCLPGCDGQVASQPQSAPAATVKKARDQLACQRNIPDNWWPVRQPGVQAKAPLLFGYRLCGQNIERVAFGFPGVPDRPVLKGEVGEWRPTGSDNPYGYWVYYREVPSLHRAKD